MLSSLLVSIYQCQTGSRSVARTRVSACARVDVTDEENGCGQERMRSALVRGGCWDEMNYSVRACVRA